MAIAIAHERAKGQALNVKEPRKGFDAKFCDSVRMILATHPLLKDRVRVSTLKESGKSPHDNTIRDLFATLIIDGLPQGKDNRGKQADETKRERVLRLIGTGQNSTRKIAAAANVSQTLVWRLLKRSSTVPARAGAHAHATATSGNAFS